MNISAKDLRREPGKILKKVARGQEIIVTYRGKRMAKFVSLESRIDSEKKTATDGRDDIFGLWKDHDNAVSVDETIRELRRGRTF